MRRLLAAIAPAVIGLVLAGGAATSGASPGDARASSVPGAQVGTTDATAETIDVVSYNVLAPIWASPEWYPEIDEPELLDADFRRERITAYLASLRPDVELVCLQEVAASELPSLSEALGPGFVGAMARNDPAFWEDWSIPPLVWEPNGTAIFVRTDAFDDVVIEDRPLGTGNHGSLLTATHVDSGRRLRAWSLHLDSDRTSNRAREMDSALAAVPPAVDGVDVVCGDLNEDAVIGTIGGRLRRAGFTDVLAAVGVREATHPWSETYYRADRWAILDHVVVRGATPRSGSVVDAGVAAIDDQSTRIEEFLRRMGSDHYPVRASVSLR